MPFSTQKHSTKDANIHAKNRQYHDIVILSVVLPSAALARAEARDGGHGVSVPARP